MISIVAAAGNPGNLQGLNFYYGQDYTTFNASKMNTTNMTIWGDLCIGGTCYTSLSGITSNASWNETFANTLYAPKTGTYDNITSLQANAASSSVNDTSRVANLAQINATKGNLSGNVFAGNVTRGSNSTLIDSSALYSTGSLIGLNTTSPTEIFTVNGRAYILNINTSMDWTNNTNYPSACSAGNAITALGDTVTCSPFATSSGSGNVTAGTLLLSSNNLTYAVNRSQLGSSAVVFNPTTGYVGIGHSNPIHYFTVNTSDVVVAGFYRPASSPVVRIGTSATEYAQLGWDATNDLFELSTDAGTAVKITDGGGMYLSGNFSTGNGTVSINNSGSIKLRGSGSLTDYAEIYLINSVVRNYNANTYYGAYLELYNTGNANVIGTYINPLINTGASTAIAMGHQVEPRVQATSTASYYSFYAKNPISSGTFSAGYGVYIDTQNESNNVNAWGLYQAGALDKNYFAGPVYLNFTPSCTLGTETLASGRVSCLSSSMRYKSNIENLPSGFAVNTLSSMQLKGFHYDKADRYEYGMIAEEIEAIDKTLVFYNNDGQVDGINYFQVVALLVQANNEMRTQICAKDSTYDFCDVKPSTKTTRDKYKARRDGDETARLNKVQQGKNMDVARANAKADAVRVAEIANGTRVN